MRYATFLLLTLAPALRGGPAAFRSKAPALQVLRGLALVGSALSFMAALRSCPSPRPPPSTSSRPSSSPALSIPILGEVVGVRRWAAVAVGLAGVLVIVRPGGGAYGAEVLLPVLTAASWALAVVATRKMAGADRPATTLFWSAAVGFAVLSALLPFDFAAPSAAQVGLACSGRHILGGAVAHRARLPARGGLGAGALRVFPVAVVRADRVLGVRRRARPVDAGRRGRDRGRAGSTPPTASGCAPGSAPPAARDAPRSDRMVSAGM
jgi:hypothetical protein